MPRMKTRYKILFGLGAVILLVLSIGTFLMRKSISRWYEFAGYCNGAQYFYTVHERLPATLEEIEDEYNRYKGRLTDLPMPAGYRRPTFYSTADSSGVTSILIVETKPGGFDLPTRWVVRGRDDGELDLKIESLWTWEVRSLLPQPKVD